MKYRKWDSKTKAKIVLDWYSKKILGFSLKKHSKTDDWLEALNHATNNQFPMVFYQRTKICFLWAPLITLFL